MPKAAIVHGTKGSPDGNWFRWLAAELVQNGYDTYLPQFPTPDGQTLSNWLKHFDAKVGELDGSSLLIGHSVGAVFVLRLLERLRQPIFGAVLVAGFTGSLGLPEYDALNSTFVTNFFNWRTIRNNAGNILCFDGDRDPYVPANQGQEIVQNLGVRQIIIKNGGHLNAEFGFTSFPAIMEELVRIGACSNTQGKSHKPN